ncbi:MAG TPA: hypothetical protein VFQ41_00225 [Candidatus Angelobacter sp.]|nr:hypothetical protein [Candidatus Angelobacter sp.]
MSLCRFSIFAPCVLALAVQPSAAAQAGAHSIAPSSGKALCSALAPADFTKAGVPVQALSPFGVKRIARNDLQAAKS